MRTELPRDTPGRFIGLQRICTGDGKRRGGRAGIGCKRSPMGLSALAAMAMGDGFQLGRQAIFDGAAEATASVKLIHVMSSLDR